MGHGDFPILCRDCGAPLRSDQIRDGQRKCAMCLIKRHIKPPKHRNVDSNALTNPKLLAEMRSSSKNRGALPLPSKKKREEVYKDLGSIVLEGKYRLYDEIGRGATGTVFIAEDTVLKRTVAVKFLLPELANSLECAESFQSEAVGMAAIRDNNVAQIYTYGEHGNIPYFIMEFLDGETVEKMIDTHNTRGFYVTLSDTLDILIQSLSGLASIHRAGAIHRDIKPANIMLSGNPIRAVIMDFGLVRTVRMDDDFRALAGTPGYIAPELVLGHNDAQLSPLIDVYSMGTTAYELLTGTLPFTGDTWVDILRKHTTEMPALPSEKRLGLPSELDGIILRALSKKPEERYPTCEEFLEDLFEIQQIVSPDERRTTLSPSGSIRLISRPPSDLAKTDDTTGTAARIRSRLLVADSDEDFISSIRATVAAAVPSCRLNSAKDGPAALSLIEKFRPHVLVLDLSLPKVNGLEVAATVRGDDSLRDIKIVVVANNSGRREADILKGLGIKHFLTKPIDTDELADLLRPMLEIASSRPPGFN